MLKIFSLSKSNLDLSKFRLTPPPKKKPQKTANVADAESPICNLNQGPNTNKKRKVRREHESNM